MSFEDLTMTYKITVTIGSSQKKVFLPFSKESFQGAFSPIHKHTYAEVHLIGKGEMLYEIGDATYTAKEGDILFIPREHYHCSYCQSPSTVMFAFLLDDDSQALQHYHICAELINNFFEELRKSLKTGNFTLSHSYLTLLCSYFFQEIITPLSPVTDYGLLIEEFFDRNYAKNPSLSALADVLHFSNKQASRLVQKYTGHTFKKELSMQK